MVVVHSGHRDPVLNKPDESQDMNKAQVCIASVWFEGNPCNVHARDLGDIVKSGVEQAGLVAFQTAVPGVRWV